MQERLLSPRTIHFATPVTCECREARACEVYPIGLMEDQSYISEKVWPSLPVSCENGALQAWEDAVFTYCFGRLTRSEDKLVAISGIAKTFETMSRDEY